MTVKRESIGLVVIYVPGGTQSDDLRLIVGGAGWTVHDVGARALGDGRLEYYLNGPEDSLPQLGYALKDHPFHVADVRQPLGARRHIELKFLDVYDEAA